MSVDGSWKITLQTPMGAQASTLALATEGATLTGSLESPFGALPIEDGIVDGNQLTWKAKMTAPMAMTLDFTASVQGDEISGEVKMGGMGSAPFSGTRA